MKQYIIGCSGFHYKHWRGIFYPEKLAVKYWFEFYFRHFSTLELNVTFYRFPKLSTLQQWYDRAPDDFIFSVKVPRSITHFKKLNDTSRMVEEFYSLVREGLKNKLGSVLFQFPPNFSASDIHIQRLVRSVDPSFENVAEFRHPSWWNEQVIAELGEHRIAFCGMSHPDLPDSVVGNTDHLYYRMHGRQQLYVSDYDEKVLSDIVDQIERMPKIKRAYIYFNNDVLGYAIENAITMIQLASLRNIK
ncbi:uncharacterized protein YecE (DUF72 family) [Pedobacter sp. AK017]|uniref:DUF72 domain-containing protein n=1 Tax=Pedobacter sp. AK017 TaxID=2723073 RepID=UPI001612AD2B|nr:DUF72 domain-containing protein [Pedobacter sp. AK017]MBB5440226.1 uncharacterized protein YecE (DUF72 family) [Pedobacter sp. AK017]